MSARFLSILFVASSLVWGQQRQPDAAIASAAREQGAEVAWAADLSDSRLWGFPGLDHEGKSEWLAGAEGDLFPHFRRFTLFQETQDGWTNKLFIKVPMAMRAGDALEVVVWLRAGRGDTAGRPFVVSVSTRPVEGKIQKSSVRVDLAENWDIVSLPVQVNEDLEPGELQVDFHMGGLPHQTDIGGLALFKR